MIVCLRTGAQLVDVSGAAAAVDAWAWLARAASMAAPLAASRFGTAPITRALLLERSFLRGPR